jgi:hypothetical protein
MTAYLIRKLLLNFAPLALVSVLAAERPAAADLTFNFFPSGSDVVINSVGSLNLPTTPDFQDRCHADGFFRPQNATICTGYDAPSWGFYIDGPDGLGFTKPALIANSVTGPVVGMAADVIVIDKSYTLNSLVNFNSTATFNNTTLADLGFITTGVIATWNLRGSSQTVQVVATPGPLPLLGASAAFGFSRRLRSRIRLSQPLPKA